MQTRSSRTAGVVLAAIVLLPILWAATWEWRSANARGVVAFASIPNMQPSASDRAVNQDHDHAVDDHALESAITPEPPSSVHAPIIIRPDPNPLAQYLLESMRTWKAPKTLDDELRYSSIAEDIALTTTLEDPIWDNDLSRARTGTLLAAVALFESGLQAYVDLGLCNDWGWRSSPEGRRTLLSGDCDGGLAVSLWQIHPEGGITLTADGGWHHSYGEGIGSAELRDRVTAARVALHMMRQSIQAGAGLCQYSGELGPCPKAAARLQFAEGWSQKHPF